MSFETSQRNFFLHEKEILRKYLGEESQFEDEIEICQASGMFCESVKKETPEKKKWIRTTNMPFVRNLQKS